MSMNKCSICGEPREKHTHAFVQANVSGSVTCSCGAEWEGRYTQSPVVADHRAQGHVQTAIKAIPCRTCGKAYWEHRGVGRNGHSWEGADDHTERQPEPRR